MYDVTCNRVSRHFYDVMWYYYLSVCIGYDAGFRFCSMKKYL